LESKVCVFWVEFQYACAVWFHRISGAFKNWWTHGSRMERHRQRDKRLRSQTFSKCVLHFGKISADYHTHINDIFWKSLPFDSWCVSSWWWSRNSA
jgi:hypothetical protein